ncbi:MAG TPA: hypothetical protein ENO11_01690, partial [Desulfobacteraceae bacterium]|nr:hypothetical protein [Desulfobacteraceae bacterium]
DKQHQLDHAARRIRRFAPASHLQMQCRKLDDLHRRLLLSARRNIEIRQDSLAHAAGLLDAVSPLSTLARGYAIARTPPPEGKIITNADQVGVGNRIQVTLHRGILECRIEKTGDNRLSEGVQLDRGRKRSIK